MQYIYIYMCVCVCLCVCARARARKVRRCRDVQQTKPVSPSNRLIKLWVPWKAGNLLPSLATAGFQKALLHKVAYNNWFSSASPGKF
jgi:hypothetical protein